MQWDTVRRHENISASVNYRNELTNGRGEIALYVTSQSYVIHNFLNGLIDWCFTQDRSICAILPGIFWSLVVEDSWQDTHTMPYLYVCHAMYSVLRSMSCLCKSRYRKNGKLETLMYTITVIWQTILLTCNNNNKGMSYLLNSKTNYTTNVRCKMGLKKLKLACNTLSINCLLLRQSLYLTTTKPNTTPAVR